MSPLLPPRVGLRDCRHDTEPGCAVKGGIETGSLDPARHEAHRWREREAFEVQQDERALIDKKRQSRIAQKALRAMQERKGQLRPGRAQAAPSRSLSNPPRSGLGMGIGAGRRVLRGARRRTAGAVAQWRRQDHINQCNSRTCEASTPASFDCSAEPVVHGQAT